MDAITGDRVCHNCSYSLRGHEAPARCPECGVTELPAEVVAEARWAMTGHILPRFFFAPKQVLTIAWDVARLPVFQRMASRRLTIVVLWLLILVGGTAVLCRFGSHGHPAGGVIEQRTWWYAIQYNGSSTGPGSSALGFVDWFYFTRGAPLTTIRAVAQRLIPEAHLFIKDCFKGIRQAVLTAGVITAATWCVLLGLQGGIGLTKVRTIFALLLNSLYPSLTTATLLVGAKLGYVFWFWGEWPVYVLAVINIIACLMAPFAWIRMTWACPAARWRLILCALTIGLCWLYMVLGVLATVPDMLWNWI